MMASATVVNNSKLNAQQGFSLIELLVVVAIIGVLAAAGIVGYQSYLDGVKKDTQVNNAQAIAKAMQLAVTAANADLAGHKADCKSSAITTNALAKDCIEEMLDGDIAKWKSPFNSSLEGDTYFVEGACTAGTISITYSSGSPSKVTLNACDNESSPSALKGFEVPL